MANYAIAWATSQNIKAPEKPVLMILANRLNGKTGACFPSHKKIAEDTGYGLTTVKKALQKLKELGLIDWTQNRKTDGGLSSNNYELKIKGPPSADGYTHRRDATDSAPTFDEGIVADRNTPRSRGGEKPEVQTINKTERKREPWQIDKDITIHKRSISKIKADPENRDGWVTNNNANGGYPKLNSKAKAKAKVETLQAKIDLLDSELLD